MIVNNQFLNISAEIQLEDADDTLLTEKNMEEYANKINQLQDKDDDLELDYYDLQTLHSICESIVLYIQFFTTPPPVGFKVITYFERQIEWFIIDSLRMDLKSLIVTVKQSK